MKQKTQFFSKVLALLLVGLFLGTAVSVLATNGEDDKRGDYEVVLTLNETERTVSRGDPAVYKGVIKNRGTNNDSYEISFGGKDHGKDHVWVELSGGDTDEVINISEPLPIDAGEEFRFHLKIIIDKEEGDYEISMMTRSTSDEDVWDAAKTKTQIVEENRKDYDFEFLSYEEEQTTTYGVPVTYFMTLVNTGNVEDSYALDIVVPGEYFHVMTTLWLEDDETFGLIDAAEDDFKIELDPDEKAALILEVTVLDIRDTEDPDNAGNDPATGSDGTLLERYVVKVTTQSLNGPEILKAVKTVTTIRTNDHARLFFEARETHKRIVAGGEAEYVLVLSNRGWAPVEVTLFQEGYPYSDITAELFLIAPYWIMDYDSSDGYYPGTSGGMNGVVYDENGNIIRLDDDDIIWDDYGGLIPVDEDFSYVVSPYESVEFLLRVNHLYEKPQGNVTPAIYSAEYELGVTVESVDTDFSKTVTTTTEVTYNPSYGIEMGIDENRKVVRPQEPAEYFITLKNTGNVEALVELALAGGEELPEGVYAYMYVLNHWTEPYPMDPWLDPATGWDPDDGDDGSYLYTDPIVVYENGEKKFHYGWCPQSDIAPGGCIPPIVPGELMLNLEPGKEVVVVLRVSIYYEEGVFNISVDGVVADHPETLKSVMTHTVVREEEYKGFLMEAPETEQSAFAGEKVDYAISLYNPSYYTDEIILSLGGKDINTEGVKAQLFVRQNIYYFEPEYGEFLRKDNTDITMEYGGSIYDPTTNSEKELEEKYPDYDEGNFPWADEDGKERRETDPDAGTGSGGSGTSNDENHKEEYYFDNTGNVYKNYEYERDFWEGPDHDFDEDDWLLPLPGDEKRITLGPFEEVWLVLRVVVEEKTGIFNIDVAAQSARHPEYQKIVSTKTHIKEGGEHGLELFIGDPVHYTAYGITTVYVFQLTNTGDVRDTVLLDIEGRDANDPAIYVEIGVKGADPNTPVFFRDDYNNVILPYDNKGVYNDERYYYEQWADDDNARPGNLPFEDGSGKEGYKKELATADGTIVGEEGWPGASSSSGGKGGSSDESLYWGEPVEYSYMNWDVSEEQSKGQMNGITYQHSEERKGDETDEDDLGFYDLDTGFIPYINFGEKYVDIEAGETIIVTMKVTVYEWKLDWFYGDHEDPDDDKDGAGDEKGETGEKKEKKEDDVKKDGYEIILTAKSKRAPKVVARAKTITHIYDENIQNGIKYRKVSGIFNVHNRNVSHVVFEKGFEILPQILESGRIEIKVRANFTEGRLVVLNINATNLRELGEFDILFDELKIDRMNADKIINYTGEKARYALLETDGGIQLMVYIPHFSEHSIAIQSAAVEESDSGFSGSVLAMGMVLGVVVGIISLGYVQRREVARRKEFKLKLHEDVESGFLTLENKKTDTGKENADELERLLSESLLFEKKV